MSYVGTKVVEVHCWDTLVGAVAIDPSSGFYAFEYTDEWLSRGVELAPLHTPLRRGAFEYADLPEPTYYRLPAFLADSLPDAFGNALVNAWMAEHGVAAQDITSLDRLAYAGSRAVGALTYRPPARPQQDETTAVQLADLVVAARQVVRGDFSTAETMEQALTQLIQVGTSAGGARAKAVVAYNPQTDQVRSGQARAPEGFEQWLIKLDGVSDTTGGPNLGSSSDVLGDSTPYGRIEYAYYLMAGEAGLDMTECRLLPEGPRAHFMTRRFDREGADTRHHVLTLCAMAHLDYRQRDTHSYAQYFQTIDTLGLGAEAREQAYRRMCFNVLAMNRDDHTKNLSFLLRENARWELAPAYDVSHAYNPRGDWTQRHQMSVNGAFEGITRDDLYAVGEQYDVPGYKRATADVVRAAGGWERFAEEAGVPDEHVARVRRDLDRVAID